MRRKALFRLSCEVPNVIVLFLVTISRPSKVTTSTRNAHSPATSQSVDASWAEPSSRWRCSVRSSSAAITCTTSASTSVSRSVTRTCRCTCPLVFVTWKSVISWRWESAVLSQRLFASTCWKWAQRPAPRRLLRSSEMSFFSIALDWWVLSKLFSSERDMPFVFISCKREGPCLRTVRMGCRRRNGTVKLKTRCVSVRYTLAMLVAGSRTLTSKSEQ